MNGASQKITRNELRVFWFVTALAIMAGVICAIKLAWTCDDSYISFQYSRNLLRGLGLVFNPGERVEGETNFLWTLWAAAGMRVGVTPEMWANIWGIISYAATIGLLAILALRRGGETTKAFLPLPVAALGAALHYDWTVFATSGLETSFFILLAVTGYAALVWQTSFSTRGLLFAGFILALCSLTRPDGIIFAFCGGLYVLWQGKPRFRCALVYTAAFAAIWVPFMMWRYGYYGDIFPNTYYAKSAYLTWYSQGWSYLMLYLERYWILLAVPALALAFAKFTGSKTSEAPKTGGALPPSILLALVFGGVYTFYIVRVGGDFMFARLLLPATPFALIFLEYALGQMRQVQAAGKVMAVVAVFLAVLVISPSPLSQNPVRHGVMDERAYYSPALVADTEKQASILKKYFAGLPVRLAFGGGTARTIYRLDVPLAIESATGLTDRVIARQVLKERGRPGHEKPAPAAYLLERRVDFLLGQGSDIPETKLLPQRFLIFPGGAAVFVITKSPAIYPELVRRGAVEFER